MADCTVYIDEAGDLGINRGTDWFVLSAVIVDKNDEPQIRSIIQSLKADINVHEIHMRNIKQFDKRALIVSRLNQSPFTSAHIIVNTSMIKMKPRNESSNERISVLSYNHICRYLLERVSWLLRDTNRKADIVLSARGTSRDNDLIDYINKKLIAYDLNQVADRFGRISAKPSSTWDLLQLADVCATSMFFMHEKNRFGFTSPCFAYRLNSHLYKHNGRILKYGIKYYSDEMHPGNDYFSRTSLCQKK